MRRLSILIASLSLLLGGCNDGDTQAGTSGDPPGEGGPPQSFPVFQPPVLECRAPSEGEPPGQSDGGEVCTWTMISGCTEPGRKFAEYTSCDPVYTQRPYRPVAPPEPFAEPDPRMADPAYVTELGWVREQVEACACVCCHQQGITPKGAAVWDIDAPGNWMNTFSAYGLAFAGGFIDSSLLGAYPAEENNGFDRATTGLPSTDPARMAAFFANELAYRGQSPEDFAEANPTPEFFYQQSIYEPEACAEGEGMRADGTIAWSGGPARYVYVLESDAANPGVPPNLDLPEGTLWRLDVDPDAAPLAPGSVRYGEISGGAKQGFPAAGAAAPLTPGATYYLYVLADVGFPFTRCLFTYEES
ncbi:hypothetical protein [Chondromyces apiculatus]|uniref:Uncharacterized protein n=1 Tax=Chondromyces apiculatus DSM 436 TaxID=1192034 RepID=A0A017SZ74_9BACT|nr:hypothetical protein [Chondromyces apiculatus]EYF02278.1 Hypothetical protein CAP_7350 [Chondromyces apiculatus DSM 436]